jgi:hypothetical protein
MHLTQQEISANHKRSASSAFHYVSLIRKKLTLECYSKRHHSRSHLIQTIGKNAVFFAQ